MYARSVDRDGAEPSRTVSIPGRPPQREQALAAGDRIERYELESRIGAGGMGVVWAARDPDLDRRVAIKLVHHDVALDDAQERLLREGQAMAKLSHPAVVPVFDIGRAGEQLFIVMELVEGSTLRQALRSK